MPLILTTLSRVAAVACLAAVPGCDNSAPVDAGASQRCENDKRAFAAYPFYSARFDELRPGEVPASAGPHWVVELDGVELPVPVAAYEKYSVRRNGDYLQLALSAANGIELAVSRNGSRESVANARVRNAEPAQGGRAPGLSIGTMFDYVPADIPCDAGSREQATALIELMRLKGSAIPANYPDPGFRLARIASEGRYGYVMRSTAADRDFVTWRAEFVEGQAYVVWAFRFPATAGDVYGDTGLLTLGSHGVNEPDWWPGIRSLLVESDFERSGALTAR